MKKITGTLLLSGALCAVSHASVVVGFDFTEAQTGATAVSTGTNNATISTALALSNPLGMSYILDGSQVTDGSAVTLSDGGFTGVYHLSVEASTSNGNVGRGGTGTMGDDANSNQLMADSITYANVVMTYVSGDDKFQFDGFTGICVANLGSGETFTITDGDGTTLMDVVNGDSNEGAGGLTTTAVWDEVGAPALADTIIISNTTGGNGGSINVVDAQFSVIPEPATLGLIAAFGGGILFIRRRLAL